MVGELTVSTIYEVGEPLTGCCAVVAADHTGNPVEVSYVTMTWYAVTVADDFDVRVPLDSSLLNEGEDVFRFTVPTDDLALGYYDIRLGVPFLDQQWTRVEVMLPAE